LVTIDLLGFGQSQRPAWAVYDAKTQARAVAATFLKLRLTGRVIIVGHSLGALVAVEIAKRYPLLVRSLVLCSPPFYRVDAVKRRLLPGSDKVLANMFRLATRHPEEFIKISGVAMRLGLVNKSFSLTRDDAPSYMNALEATIINQTSLGDAVKLKVPMQLLYGRLDPVVVVKNLRYLVKNNSHAQLTTLLTGHEVKGSLFIKATVKAINHAIANHK
jgi:pimeloyl-ACP methyl ester carboxylesterase